MKKLIIAIAVLMPFVSCLAQINKDLSLCITKLKPEAKDPYNLCYNIYSVELELCNRSSKPISYWSWSCSWADNFILNNDYFLSYECRSNMIVAELLLPKISKKYSGTLYSKTTIKNKNDLIIGFKYFNTFKIDRESYLHYWLKEDLGSKVIPDTVWNKNNFCFVGV